METEPQVRVVTGATAGIGRSLAQQLATAGGTIVLVARDRTRAESVRTEMATAAPNTSVELILADLSSLAEVRRAGGELSSAHPRIASVVHCAAVFSSARVETADGLELMFATNHLGPFLLTSLLLPALRAHGHARVLTLAAPSTSKLDFDDLQGASRFRALSAFGASKAANLLFTFELARRAEGSGMTANAVHPGLARTSLMHQAPALLRVPVGLFSAPPDRVAARIAPLILDEEYANASGLFFHKGKPIDPPPYARDPDVQRRLWDVSERLAGLA